MKNNNNNGDIFEKRVVDYIEKKNVEHVPYKFESNYSGDEENKGCNYIVSQSRYFKTDYLLAISQGDNPLGEQGKGDLQLVLFDFKSKNSYFNFDDIDDMLPLRINVECKYQEVIGTTKEKIKYAIHQLKWARKEQYNILLVDGNQFSQQQIKEFKHWCRKKENEEPYKKIQNEVVCMTLPEFEIFINEILD